MSRGARPEELERGWQSIETVKRAQPTLLVLLILWRVFLPDSGNAEGPEEQRRPHLSGEVSTRYRTQWNADDTDHNFLQYLNFDLKNLLTPKLSLHGFLRAGEDLDDSDPIFDWTNYDVQDRIYDLYLEGEGVIPYSSFRAGRQYYDGLEGVQFDGLRFFRDEGRWLKWGAIGGRYVSFYDRDLQRDSMVAGAHATASFLRGASFSTEYLRLMGFPTGDDDYLGFAFQQRLERLSSLTRYSVLNGESRDVSTRVFWVVGSGWEVSAKYFRLLHSIEELSNEFDPYYPLFGAYMGFHQYDVDVTKHVGDRFSVSGGYAARRLVGEEVESVANREFDRYYASFSARDVPTRDFGVFATIERWLASDGEENYSAGGEVSYRLKRKLDVAVGTYYSKYKYDIDTITEKTDVRSVYARVKYHFNPKAYLSVKAEREDDDSPESPYGRAEIRMTYRF